MNDENISNMTENPLYLSSQLITYLGNKRQLLGQIEASIIEVKNKLGVEKIRSYDAFAGSGVVSRLLKSHSSHVISNDMEGYSSVIGQCYLSNKKDVDIDLLEKIVADFNARVDFENYPMGFFEDLYAPHDEAAITENDRAFYTIKNARRLDRYRQMIETAPSELKDYLLAPLLAKASVHVNTSGVFKGFYKSKETGFGMFGGDGKNALQRIFGDIQMEVPVLSNYSSSFEMIKGDANKTSKEIGPVDFAYFDPPYNQHPYGSNYFMLNLLVSYERPTEISRVSGIPKDWNRSEYNKKQQAVAAMDDLVKSTEAKFIAISFNDEGFISDEEMQSILRAHGKVSLVEIPYSTFKGSRNLASRSNKVMELLYLLERK